MRACAPLLAALTLALLAPSARAGSEDSASAPEARGPRVGPGDEVRRLQVSTRVMDDARRRLALIEEIQDLEQAIADLEALVADLMAERQQWETARAQLDGQIDRVNAEIADTRAEIEAVEQAIAASTVLSAGIPNPELLAAKAALERKLTRLKNDRSAARDERRTASQVLARVEELLLDAKARLAAKRQQKHGTDARLAEVSITAPSEGARIMLGVVGKIQIRAPDPPHSILVQLQRGSSDLRGGTLWSTVYERALRWQDLESTSPSLAALRFRTGASTTGRTIHDPHGIRLEKGPHRVSVERVGPGVPDPSQAGGGSEDPRGPEAWEAIREDGQPRGGDEKVLSDSMQDGDTPPSPPKDRMAVPVVWRHFEVVGRVGSQAFEDRPGPGEVGLRPGKPQAPGRIDGVKRPPPGLGAPPGGVQSPTGGDDEPEAPPKLRGFPRR